MSSDKLYTCIGYVDPQDQNNIFKRLYFESNNQPAIEEAIQAHRHTDCYISKNTFSKKINEKRYVAELSSIVIDADVHTIMQGYSIEAAQELTKKMLSYGYFGNELPNFSLIIHSGRGMHAHIRLASGETDISRWQKVGRELSAIFDYYVGIIDPLTESMFELDSSVINNAAGFIRAHTKSCSTFNTKANTYTTGLHYSDATYTLDELERRFINPFKESHKGTKLLVEIMHNARTTRTNNQGVKSLVERREYKPMRSGMTESTYRQAAMRDILKLAKMRNENMRLVMAKDGSKRYVKGNHGTRSLMLLFYAAICKREYNSTQQVYDHLTALNNVFKEVPDDDIVDHRELQKIYTQIINKDMKPGNKAMISYFNITADEMAQLDTLIDKKEVQKRTLRRVKLYKSNKSAQKLQHKCVLKAQAQALRS
ncbi:hypothetical protein EG832_13700, partial [bacterium]|nr:hypothetical protein [bacterium]